jgi:outer membrane protein assembly factor BamB
MQKLKATATRLWAEHRKAVLVGGISLAVLVIGGAIAAYFILKRPADVSNPDAEFVAEEIDKAKGEEDWPFYGLNEERTRYLAAKDLEPPFRVKWRFNGRKLLEYSPVLAGGSIYGINNNGEAFSVKTRNGKVRWRREIATLNASSPAYADGQLFVANLEPGQVQALNAKNGNERWVRGIGGRTESSPVVVGNKVIVGCECGTLYAFDAATGKTLWETDLPGEIKAAPAVSDGVAYVGDYSGSMNAVRVRDGEIEWQSSSQGTGTAAGSFYGTAAVAFGRVYAGSKDGRIYSFEKRTGDLAWSQTIGGEVYAGAVAADTPKTDPTVYFGTFGDSTFYALDARSGEERWTGDAGGSVIGAASLIGETVYVASVDTTETVAMDAATGEETWVFRDGAYNPVISDGERLYLTGYKNIYAMKKASAKDVKRKEQAKGAGGDPAAPQ